MSARCCLAILLVLVVPDRLAAQLLGSEITAPDARALGMGEAFTAVAEGPAAVWWNPGALALSRGVAISPFSRRQLLPEILDDYRIYSAGGAAEIGIVGLGFHYSDLDLDFGGLWSEYTLHFGVGVDMQRLIATESAAFDWGIGAAFKYSSITIRPSDDGLTESSGTGWDADLGSLAVYRFPMQITSSGGREYVAVRGGVNWKSVFGRDVELGEVEQRDPFEQSVVLGVASELVLKEATPSRHFLRATLSLEHQEFIGSSSEVPGIQRYGFELGLGVPADNPTLFLAPRVGYINDIYNEIRDVAYGGGIGADIPFRDGAIGGRFDYARVPRSEGLEPENQYTVSLWTRY